MATLEWLLIVAAVAALAALATVLVTVRVEDTAERISNPDPRVMSAVHSALAVESDAKAAAASDFDSWDDWERHFSRQCSVIAVLYSDAEVKAVHNNFTRAAGGGTTFDPAAAGAADELPAAPGKAQVQCVVG